MKINVTQKDIIASGRGSNSGRNNATECLIATVLRRRHIKFESVGYNIHFRTSTGPRSFILPAAVKHQIENWIYNRPITLFSFDLEIPEGSQN